MPENIQSELVETGVPINNIRYWSINVYVTNYFSEYLFLSLKRDIKKRILNNSQSGSSCRFRRFLCLNSKVHSTTLRVFLLDMGYLDCYAEVSSYSDESEQEKEDGQVSLNNFIDDDSQIDNNP